MIRTLASEINRLARGAARAEDKPITLLFFATGVVITLFQYREYLETQRVATSYEHVQEWEEKGYKAAFDTLSQTIRETEIAAIELLPEDLDETAFKRAQLNVVQKTLAEAADQPLGAEIDKLIYFFDKLSVCVDRNLCDADLLEVFFKDNLTRMWIYSSTFVAIRKDEIDGYADLTEAYQDQLRTPRKGSIWDYWPF